MTDTAAKVAHNYLHKEGTPVRVAARYVAKKAEDAKSKAAATKPKTSR